MRLGLLLAAGLGTLMIIPPPVAAQSGVIYRLEIHDRTTSRIVEGARQVTVQFQIRRAADNALVNDVAADEIVVEEDGEKVAGLTIAPPRATRMTVVLVLDISGSMDREVLGPEGRTKKIEEAKKAALLFLERLDARTDVGLILFDHQIRVAVAPAQGRRSSEEQRRVLTTHISSASPQGGTAYFDATVTAAEMLRKVPDGQKIIVLMTDGVDMNSRASLPEAIRAAQAAEVPVYTLGIGAPGKNETVSTILVLDVSGSMLDPANDTDRIPKILALKDAAGRFVDLMRAGSRSTVLPFNSTFSPPAPFTANKADLRGRIDALNARGGTYLYDATVAAVDELASDTVKGRKAVVVLTDGIDQRRGKYRRPEDVIERAKQVGLPLHMLGLGRPGELDERSMRKMGEETGGSYSYAGNRDRLVEVFEGLSIRLHDDGIDEASLRELANKTGGKYTHVSDISSLSFIYGRLADELQATYRVTFTSKRSVHDGTARGISVKVMRGGVVVSNVGAVDDVARGVVVPQADALVYLAFLLALGGLLALPAGLRKLNRPAAEG